MAEAHREVLAPLSQELPEWVDPTHGDRGAEAGEAEGCPDPDRSTSGVRDFDEDLQEWVSNVSETFHVRIFFVELLGQLSFTFFWCLSYPWILPLYGGRVGLINRGFWNHKASRPPFIFQSLATLLMVAALVVLRIFRPPDVNQMEVKFLLAGMAMRNLTIAIKYAYMTGEAWDRFNTEILSREYIGALLILRWLSVTPEVMALQAEISFVGVLGSREQRRQLRMRFLAWPTSVEEVAELRQKVDYSSKALKELPTGQLHKPTSRFRKKVTERLGTVREGPRGLRRVSSVHFGQVVSHLNIAALVPGRGGAKEESEQSTGKSRLVDSSIADELVFSAAAAGRSVPLEDLFLYMLRGLIRSQSAHMPRWTGPGMVLFCTLTVLTPSIMRRLSGRGFLGDSAASAVVIAFIWPCSLLAFYSCVGFIYAGAVDMWRRRALLRSCAALLTLQRVHRRHCVAEVDLLPILDLTDPNTIEAWRKLRQLCMDWGKFYFLRIQAFATLFFGCTIIVIGDTLASMQIEAYMRLADVRLSHLLVAGSMAMTVLLCIFVLVHFGQEVNEAAATHISLLQRQRLLFLSRRLRGAAEAAREGKPLPSDDDMLERLAHFLDALCTDIAAQHAVSPVRLLGLYCGYSLLSGLYFVPAGVLAVVSGFCSSPATAARCSVTGG